MAEDKEAFDRECEIRRSDLARIQNKRVQEFDLLTTTAGLDLIHIVEATEPNSPVEAILSTGNLFDNVSNRPAMPTHHSEVRKSFPFTSSASTFSPARIKNQQSSTTKVIPQYVPVVSPKTRPSPGQPSPETTHL